MIIFFYGNVYTSWDTVSFDTGCEFATSKSNRDQLNIAQMCGNSRKELMAYP